MARKQTYRHARGIEANPALRGPIYLTTAAREAFEEGKVLLIDKPVHWTSFDLVRKIRGVIRIKKIGHAGTLDPLASGLMILCTGKYTKRIQEYMAEEKEYTAEITLGATTPTYDLESTPQDFKDTGNITETYIREKLRQFTGDIMQRPPVYSAIKKEGVTAYELARRGDDVDLAPRPVHIAEFEIMGFEGNTIRARIVCSTGTYIRSLAHDLGEALGCGGYLSALRRTRIGSFRVEDAQTMEAFWQFLKDASEPEGNGQNG